MLRGEARRWDYPAGCRSAAGRRHWLFPVASAVLAIPRQARVRRSAAAAVRWRRSRGRGLSGIGWSGDCSYFVQPEHSPRSCSPEYAPTGTPREKGNATTDAGDEHGCFCLPQSLTESAHIPIPARNIRVHSLHPWFHSCFSTRLRQRRLPLGGRSLRLCARRCSRYSDRTAGAQGPQRLCAPVWL